MNIDRLKKKFSEIFGDHTNAPHLFFAPGRVCLIGEHIDYNGGLVLPAALSMGIYAAFRPDDSRQIKMRSGLEHNEVNILLDDVIHFNKEHSWGNYPKGVISFLNQKGIPLTGGDLLFESNLPTGAGLSSSAAIEVLTGYLFSNLNGQALLSNQDLALLCQRVENDFVGVQCGIMDQFAVAMGRKEHAMMLNCHTLKHDYVPMRLERHELVIFNTNKKRELTDSLFNTRTEECKSAFNAIREHKEIENLVDAGLEDVDQYIDDPVVRKRARHVIAENKRVFEAVNALKNNDIEKFGQLLHLTHDSLKLNYEVTGPELDAIEETARLHPACVGAKMSGAGFGGCAFALLEKENAAETIDHILHTYYQKTGLKADYYIAAIDGGVRRLGNDSMVDS